MPTLTIEKRWTSGSAWAGIKAAITYTVDNSSSPTQTTISASTSNNFTVTKTQSGSGVALTEAKQLRLNGLTQGLTYSFNCTARDGSNKEVFSISITCTGSSVDSENIVYQQKSGSYSYTKTHSAQTKWCWVRLSGAEHVSASFAVGAKPKYTITYNANGGSSTPSSQTKWYGENLTLQGAISRSDYTFQGWKATNGTTYAAKATYSGNEGTTLTAVWKDNYTAPVLTIKSVARCNSSGVADNEGTYAKAVVTWSIYKNSLNNNQATIKMTCNGVSQTITGSQGVYSGTTTLLTNSNMSIDNSYLVTVEIYDSYHSSTKTTKTMTISTAKYTIDVLQGGNGIAFGGAANKNNTMQIYYNAEFNGAINYGNNPPFKWRYETSDSITLAANEGQVYNFPSSNFTMPNISGYTRIVIPRTTNTNTVATGYAFNDDNTLNVYIRNLRSSSSNLAIRVLLFYLRNDLQWS